MNRKGDRTMLIEQEIKILDIQHFSGSECWKNIFVDDKSLNILLRIEQSMQQLAAMGDDELRSLWVEAQRGAPEDWGDFESLKNDGEVDTYDEYLELWKIDCPNEIEWWKISSMRYDGFHYLHITDGERYSYCLQSAKNVFDDRNESEAYYDVSKLLACIEIYITTLVECIVISPEAYNDYVDNNLPYKKRKGVILRSILNELLPDWYLKDVDKERAVELLEKKEEPEYFEHMTLRTYMHYWRRAYEALGYKCEEQSDIDVFRYSSKGYKVEKYNLDSEEVFTQWITDVSPYHGFDVVYARVHFFPHYENGSWNFLLSTHSYWNLNEYIRVAISMYNEGILLEFDGREKILSILRGTDCVRICPDAYRYIQSGDVGNEINLPDPNEDISVETVKLIIANTEWETLLEVKLNKRVIR